MAIEISKFKPGCLIAGADLSAKQFYFVKQHSTAFQVVLAGSGENAIGVLQNKPTSGQAAEVECLGVTKVIAGNTITAGNNLMSDSNGKAIPHTGTNAVLAVALEGASAGEYVSALLITRTGAGLSTNYSFLTIPIVLANVTDGDVVTTYTPGFAGTIQKAPHPSIWGE